MERADMADFLRGLCLVADINKEEAEALQAIATWIDEQEGEEEMGEARDTQFSGHAASVWQRLSDEYAQCLTRHPRMSGAALAKEMERVIVQGRYAGAPPSLSWWHVWMFRKDGA